MAHLEKFAKNDIAKITKEAYREYKDEKKYKNEVDLSRSHLNYSMNGLDRESFLAKLNLRCTEAMQGRKMQEQTNVIGSWVATCPQELLDDPEKVKKYFEAVHKFNCERYKEENVIDGIVHMDETTPHMINLICPVCKSRKTGKETVSAASFFTREDLRTYHKDLDVYLESVFGMSGLALNGRTKGDYTLEELKERTEQEKKLADREAAVSSREMEVAKREAVIISREKAIERREAVASLKESKVKQREAVVTSTENALSVRESDLQEREVKLHEVGESALKSLTEASTFNERTTKLFESALTDSSVLAELRRRRNKDGKNAYDYYYEQAEAYKKEVLQQIKQKEAAIVEAMDRYVRNPLHDDDDTFSY